MMKVGTSLGGCLKSLASGEVSLDDVLCIITRTKCATKEDLMRVVEDYHDNGNSWATAPVNYQLGTFDVDELKYIASELWEYGKIHQPRNYGTSGGFIHPELSRNNLWLEIGPAPNDNPAVVDAYQKYKMLVTLTKDENQY